MQSAKNFSLEDRAAKRGTSKTARCVGDKRKKVPDGGRSIREDRPNGIVFLPESKKKPQWPAVNRTVPKASLLPRRDENRVGRSIQRLLSVYETSKSPDGSSSRIAEDKKPRIHEKPGSKTGPEKAQKGRASPATRTNANSGTRNKKNGETQAWKPVRKQVSPELSKTKLVESVQAKPCDEIIPLLTPDRTVHSPVNLINSFIVNCLDEDAGNGGGIKSKLEFFEPEHPGNPFPVCSKKGTDDIPGSDRVLPEVTGNADELIIMLRRRNSEPYSPSSCILRYASDALPPDPWGCRSYCFWEPRPSRPYWEMSLFKPNRSSTWLDSGPGEVSLTSPGDGGIIINGDFGPGNRELAPGPNRKPWTSDLSACKSRVRTIPLARLPDLPRAEAQEVPDPGTRIVSKDDLFKPPAHLLVYVKSSQKKLVSPDSRRSGNCMNKKVHKIRKILGGGSSESASCHRPAAFAVASAVFLVTGGLALFLYFLATRSTFFSLTPPIPGLLRGC